jgi:hypothetical protein
VANPIDWYVDALYTTGLISAAGGMQLIRLRHDH